VLVQLTLNLIRFYEGCCIEFGGGDRLLYENTFFLRSMINQAKDRDNLCSLIYLILAYKESLSGRRN